MLEEQSDLEELIKKRTIVSKQEGLILKNIFHLRNSKAHDVMVPRAEIKALDETSTLEEALQFFTETKFAKIPVYDESLDNLIGVLNVKDFIPLFSKDFKGERPTSIKSIARQDAFDFVSPAMKSLDLLAEMQKRDMTMVFVVDEYGGVDGLITLEDLVEQVIGDLDDEEYLEQDYQVTKHSNGALELDARIPLDDAKELIGEMLLSDEEESPDIDSLGGFVADLAGRIPSRGEIITNYSGIHFQILESDSRRIKKLKIYNFPNQKVEENVED